LCAPCQGSGPHDNQSVLFVLFFLLLLI
jgi:hypothetical protein